MRGELVARDIWLLDEGGVRVRMRMRVNIKRYVCWGEALDARR
jgi:hypothetical protein